MDLLVKVLGSSLAFLGISLLLFAPLERLLPARKNEAPAPPGDWLHFFANPAIGAWVSLTLIALLGATIRSLLPPAMLAWVGGLPLLVQLLAAVFLANLWGYWAHRLAHRVPLLWRFHRVHHSIEEMHWVSAHRQHPFDVIWIVACANLPAFALGIGLGPLLIFNLLERLYTVFLHANVDCTYGWFGRFLASPRFHHWHHDMGPTGNNHNYSGTFSLFDWLFGTFHDPVEPPQNFGCSDPTPEGYVNQILTRDPPPPLEE